MTKKETYKRLTESGSKYVTNDGEHDIIIIIKLDKKGYENPQYDYDSICEKLNRLAELEDKIEDGTLVELPCKVGCTVYEVFARHNPPFINESIVEKIVITESGIKLKLSRNAMYETAVSSIGKTLFFTRKEAEAKLKELQENGK